MSRAGTGVAAVSGFPTVPSRPVTSVQARARVAEGEGYLDVLAVTAGPGYRPSRFRRARSRRPRRGWPPGMGPVGPVPGRPPRPQPSSGQAGRGPLPAGLGSGCWNRVCGAGYLDALVTGGEVDEQAGRPMSSPWRIVTRGGMSTSTTELPEQDFTARRKRPGPSQARCPFRAYLVCPRYPFKDWRVKPNAAGERRR